MRVYIHTQTHIDLEIFAVLQVLHCEPQRLRVCVCVCGCVGVCVGVGVCVSIGLDVLAVNGVVQCESGRAWGAAGRRDVYRHSTRRLGYLNPEP